MRRSAARFLIGLCAAAAVVGTTGTARAGKLDLSISRFIECDAGGRQCIADVASYERFMAEYAFGLSPKLLAPAETLGYSGFYLGLEGSLTPIPETGRHGGGYWDLGTTPVGEWPSAMFFPAVHIRKGLPWSFEIGSSINYLAQSELVGLGGEVKWSLFEGYRKGFRGALPDIAARGTVVRVLGEADVDMTIIGVDGSISYAFGLGGTLSLTPYAGFQYLWTLIRTEPLMYREELGNGEVAFHSPDGLDWDTTGLSGPNLERMKLFLGFALQYELLVITLEVDWGLAQEWETAVLEDPRYYSGSGDPAFGPDPEQLETEVGHQIQINGGVGMQF
jgi:hypothetical protein